MREISCQPEPRALTQWRAAAQGDVNFGYALMPADVREALKAALVAEQRGLCAYTGIGIGTDSSHVEHMVPQAHCQPGEDVAYKNVVACYPAPHAGYVPFGALRKGNWPSPAEQHLFISPRSRGCEDRFAFDLRGKVEPANENDRAARETIQRLGLDSPGLTARRKEAVEATLHMRAKGRAFLDLKSARKRLAGLEQAEANPGRLEPFCFVLKQALRRHIRRLDAIKQSRARKT